MAQNPPAAPKPIEAETVVGTSGDRKITAGEVSKIIEGLPPQMKQNFSRDAKGFLSQWFMLQQLVSEAEKMKLADKSPYKEGIQMARMQILSQAVIEEKSQATDIPMEEQKKLYEQRKDNFTMAKLKLIYVPFAAGNAAAAAGEKKTLTEQEAQAKAEGLVKQARGGADFVQLVKAHSEDPISKEKDGDFGPIRRNDQLPDAIKQAVFALRPGEISEPVRQPNGYYVFRLMELTPQAFEEVQTALVTELKNARLKQWLDGAAKSVELKVERPDFFESLK
jgi:peptidyl-prolyl cis-trans isomerase C